MGRGTIAFLPTLVCLAVAGLAGGACAEAELEVDLLVVGGNEAAVAAAVQASRLGVGRVALVNDIDRFGGQFSNEGVGPVDERILLNGRSVNFPRSGMALEVIRAIRVWNLRKYGMETPGNCWSATDTIEPAAAAEIFEGLLAPEVASGRLKVYRNFVPECVRQSDGRVAGVRFASADGKTLGVRARLTVDATDWGDVIRLGGVAHYAGVDPKGRFGEPSGPEAVGFAERQEMNPVTWTMTLRETDRDEPISRPAGYEPASYSRQAVWRDSGIYRETYQKDNPPTPYSQRRLVDRHHFNLPPGTETIQLNTTEQDYPLRDLPPRVVAALERLEPGLSRKNIVDMTPAQRQVVLEDAKLHSLGYLYYLQNDHPMADTRSRMRRFRLTDEFGTPDRLPPKPYIREGLRLAAMYVLREQDVRAEGNQPGWSPFRPDDAAFSFQFHIDFHPTRRYFDVPGRPDAWHARHYGERSWNSMSHRSFFPLRALVPQSVDGLLGAGKNVGVSSIVQAAFRLHGQMLLCGQAAGTLAAQALAEGREPRAVVSDAASVRAVRRMLVKGAAGHPGVAIVAWQDLTPDDPRFEAANLGPLPDPAASFFYSESSHAHIPARP